MVKRVLLFRPSLGDGGADRVTWTLLRHLDRRKFDPSIALVHLDGPFLADLPKDVTVHDLGSSRLALSVLPLAKLLRRLRPDVVFSTSSSGNVICVAAHRAARSNARLVLSERTALDRGRAGQLKVRVEVMLKRVTYPLADMVTAVSEGVAAQVVEALHVARDCVRVVYNPMVNDELDTLARESVHHPWFAEPIPIIVACGRLIGVKDYPTLITAFARVRAQQPVRLFVLGDGPLKSDLEQLARALGVESDVCFHGFDRNPFKYFARATMLMHASTVEGLPGALIQSMACGSPVVSTDCDFGPREVIRDGVDGFLVPVADVTALADRAQRIVADRTLRARMSHEGRASMNRFSLESSLARYEAALEPSIQGMQ